MLRQQGLLNRKRTWKLCKPRSVLSRTQLLTTRNGQSIYGNSGQKFRESSNVESPGRPPNLLSFEQLNYWMSKFILEIRRKDGKEYPPNTLYSVSCGVMRHVRKYCPEINFFVQAQFAGFKKTLDSEMKRLKAGGAGLSK